MRIDFGEIKKYRHFGFFGLGVSNLGLIGIVKKEIPDAKITLRQSGDIPKDALAALADVKPYRVLTGERALLDIDEDILFLSPTVRREGEILSAAERGTRLCSDAELFFGGYCGDIIGVTGSDGKSTTSYLISKILSEGGRCALPIGNYGGGFCASVFGCDFPVAELSSFQLMYMKPHLLRAVITNITENHLDWHRDFDEYRRAKLNICDNAGGIVYDLDDGECLANLSKRHALTVCSLSRSASEMRALVLSDNYISRNEEYLLLNGEEYIPIAAIGRREEHNIKNAMLAIGATLGLAKKEAQLLAISSFSGLATRLELIYEGGGVRFISSSADTTPSRTLATLSSLDGRVAAIIGGASKGLSTEPLMDRLYQLTRGAVLSGPVGRELAEKMTSDERYKDYKFSLKEDMTEAVLSALDILGGEGTVVLTPAATSFDKYKSYKDRAECYRSAVLSVLGKK